MSSDLSSAELAAYKKTADPYWRAPFNPDWDPRVALDTIAGFPNKANTCFRNVTLQMLLHLPVFLSWLNWYRQHHIPNGEDCGLGKDGFECKPCTFYALAEGYWDSSAYDYLQELENLWSRVFSDWDEGTRSGQQDTIEFLPELLSQLREQTRGLFKSDLDDIFSIPTVTHRQCLQPSPCLPTYTPDKSNFLTVRFPGDASKPESIQNMINTSFAENVISNGGCSTCRKQRATREYLGHPPEVLLVHVNRVVFKQGKMQKINQPITFGENITLSKEFFDPRLNADKDIDYELSSVQLHAGASPQEGHYRILAKGRSGRWSFIDDEKPIKNFAFAQVAAKPIQREAYVFAYRRLPVKPPQNQTTAKKVVQAKPNVKPTTRGATNRIMTVDMNAVQQKLLREKSTQPDTSLPSSIQQQVALAGTALENAALVERLKKVSREKAELEERLAEKDALLTRATSSAAAGDASNSLNGTMALVFRTVDGQVALDLSIDGNIRKLQSLPLRTKTGEVFDPDQPVKSIEFDKPTETTTGKGGKKRKSTTKNSKKSSKKRKIGKEAEGSGGKNVDESDKKRKTS